MHWIQLKYMDIYNNTVSYKVNQISYRQTNIHSYNIIGICAHGKDPFIKLNVGLELSKFSLCLLTAQEMLQKIDFSLWYSFSVMWLSVLENDFLVKEKKWKKKINTETTWLRWGSEPMGLKMGTSCGCTMTLDGWRVSVNNKWGTGSCLGTSLISCRSMKCPYEIP